MWAAHPVQILRFASDAGEIRSGDRYLVVAEASFVHEPRDLPWRTHVFSARTTDAVLEPRDANEIAGARWGTLAELAGPLRDRLLATGHAFWRYRVALHDAALAALAR